jgi:P4 family phage/plasmid primase-like protien
MITVSLGKADKAVVTRTWRGTFSALVAQLLKDVKETSSKDAAGWICGAEFSPEYRHSDNFVARHLLSLDYDHIKPEDVDRVIGAFRGEAFLAYTTWSHVPDKPRIRIWVPLSRPTSFDEFQAVSRAVAARTDIGLAARESHTPAQFMYRPCAQAGTPFQSWQDIESPYLDVDKVLKTYFNWTDRAEWPRRQGEELHAVTEIISPLDKPGVVGDFCRAFRISDAIGRFELPYRPGSSEDRWTYAAGSVPDGAVSYDNDTKLHSYHDTDPAHGQHNVYDLVRLHRFGALDSYDGDTPLAALPSSRAMARFALDQPEIRDARYAEIGFVDLDATGEGDQRVCGTATGYSREESTLPAPVPEPTARCSDLANAERIQKKYGEDIIAVGEAFYFWSGTHWVKDDHPVDRLIADLPVLIQREALQQEAAGNEDEAAQLLKWSSSCNNLGKLQACTAMLRTFLNFPGEKLNAARDTLACLSGTISLRTGDVSPHRPGDFITACAPVSFVPGAACPRFIRFLNEIFKGDESVVGFVKRWFGYCITGEVREHALLFHIGEGGNGKGVLMETLQRVLGPGYSGVGPRTLLSPNNGGASPEIAGLIGRRLVTLTETNRDEEFNEGVLKNLTGGDRLSARNLFEGYFEFNPTHKLQIFTNNEPRIAGQDRGIWRRLFLLNYDVKYGRPHEVAEGIAHEVQDEELAAKLAAEAEGIFAWLVEGAREWYAQGLNPPATVVRATKEYKARQDNVGQFIAERTVKDPLGCVALSGSTESLYGAYKGWVNEMGYYPLGRNKFAEQVKRAAPYAEYGLHIDGKRPIRGFKGIRLAAETLQ